MYYPILKGKQFELAAIRELVGHIPLNNVCPILEPVNLALGPLATTISELSASGINPWIIINPAQGDYTNNIGANITTSLTAQLSGTATGTGQFVPCIKIIDQTDTTARALLNTFTIPFVAYIEGNISPALIPELKRAAVVVLNPDKTDHAIWSMLPSVVLFHDGFEKKARNLDYADESFYSKLHTEYKAHQNTIGFGDFTSLGERLVAGGGPAFVVTIHLSFLDPSRLNHMYFRHFSSYSDTKSQSDPGGKFLEALNLLVAHVNANPTHFINTLGLQDFYALNTSGHYPGLGVVKKISIKHHIQTLSTW